MTASADGRRMTLDDIWSAITAEQVRARELHPNDHAGRDDVTDAWRHLLLSEEVGEVAAAIHYPYRDCLRDELVQVAATAVAWLRVL